MKSSFQIAEISFGRSHWNGAFEFEYQGHRFEVHRYGANFSVDNVKGLIERLRNQVDAFALSSLPPVVRLDQKSYAHRQYLDIIDTPSSVPLCDGTNLREISNLVSLMKMIENKKIEPELGVFFPSAFMSLEVEEYLRDLYRDRVYFGDAFSLFGLPIMLKPFPGLKTLSKAALKIVNLKDLRTNTPLAENRIQKMSRAGLTAQLENVQYVVSDLPFLLLFDSSVDFIRGKDLIIWSHHAKQEQEIQSYRPRSVINLFPEAFHVSPFINYSILDAVLRLSHHKTAALSIDEWQELLKVDLPTAPTVRKYISSRTPPRVREPGWKKMIKNRSASEEPPDFAFIVHALSHHDFERVPVFGKAVERLPSSWTHGFDKMVSKMPPVVWGHVRDVISEETGKKINGIVYGLWSTPKVLKETPPEETYAQIEKICYEAYQKGAKIIGLGAYTKIVGDSGITINRNSPIPVTTGNSLSTSATLWALYDVVLKMRLLKPHPNRRAFLGTAMVIGATGSIGSASAKLMSLAFSKVFLVAPRMHRLEELREEIRRISPDCDIRIATDANELASEVDVLVTATSAFDQEIIDVMRLKPGCVVCDCSRPLDFDKEDAKKRPDVLIIESGEVVLPGPSKIDCDLALPDNAVYACLGETALLALEERFEPFTLGRDIDWQKVKEIYKMAKRHGVKLSAIQGHMGFIDDREIELTAELARKRLKGN